MPRKRDIEKRDPGRPDAPLTPAETEDQAQRFFAELERNGLLPRGVGADDAAAAVFCTLTRRVTAGGARDFAESVPSMLRRLLLRCTQHRAEPAEVFDRREFVGRVAAHLGISAPDAERVANAVFSAMRACLPQNQVDDVASQLPADLRQLWRPEPPAASPRVA
jgi:uncharacterized protein (DUF2267 family)